MASRRLSSGRDGRVSAHLPDPRERAVGPDLRRHWRRSLSLTWSLLVVWFVVSFLLPFFARQLETIHLFGWPLPFYMAAQGALLVYVVIIGIYASRMRGIDREYGVDESEDHE